MGLPVGPDRLAQLAESTRWIQFRDKHEFHDAARCILVSRREHLAVFDSIFEHFWRSWEDASFGLPETPSPDEPGPVTHRSNTPQGSSSPIGRDGDQAGHRDALQMEPARDAAPDAPGFAATSGATLRQRDFARLTDTELAAARRLVQSISWTALPRPSRRTRSSRRGSALDVRKTLQSAVRHGGENTVLFHRAPQTRPRRIVLLCDVSGSMDRYTRMLLHMLHTLHSGVDQSEVFVFGTQLTRVTRELRSRDADRALAAVAVRVPDMAGGTRIGECLAQFNRVWARRVLDRGAIVLIISDGWDRGTPEHLAVEVARLQRSSYRLMWLSPLLGSPNYRPVTQGMRAALPYIDDFLPVHNLASLEALAELLGDAHAGRPVRRSRSGPLEVN